MDIGENKVKLRNVKTKIYLQRRGWGNGVTMWYSGIGTYWTVHGNVQDSSQISLESFKNDFLYRTPDGYVFHKEIFQIPWKTHAKKYRKFAL